MALRKTKGFVLSFLLFLVLFNILSSFIQLPFIVPVKAQLGVESVDLGVYSWVNEIDGWGVVGTEPWIKLPDDEDTSYIWSTTVGSTAQFFHFADLWGWEDIINVTLRIRQKVIGVGNYFAFNAYLWNGTYQIAMSVSTSNTDYGWISNNVTLILDTAEEVINARLRLYKYAGGAYEGRITTAVLRVYYYGYYKSVNLGIRAKRVSGFDAELEYQLYDGSSWSSWATFGTFTSTSYVTRKVDVSSFLNSETKVNVARLAIRSSYHLAITWAFLELTSDGEIQAHLNVEAFVNVTSDWYKDGTDPWLDIPDGDDNKIMTEVVYDADMDTDSYYTFEDVPADEIPDNIDITITNMEGGNWIFADEKHYDFEASYSHPINYSLFDTVSLSFTDGERHTINTTYNVADDEFSKSHNGTDQDREFVYIKKGTVVKEKHFLNVTFEIFLTLEIVDAYNVSLLMFSNDTGGNTNGWQVMQSDYFHIYKGGGTTVGDYSTIGTAGRLPGGDIFDFYAHGNVSSVQDSMVFRHLQHIKLLPEISFIYSGSQSYASWTMTYGIEYLLDNGTDFVTGFEVRIIAERGEVGVNAHFMNWTVDWYNLMRPVNQLVKTDVFYTFPYGSPTDDQNGTTRIWIDIWFNRVNASSTFGMRVNAYEHPLVSTVARPFQGWLSTWGIDDTKIKDAMMFDTLYDLQGNIIHASRIRLVKVYSKLQVGTGYGTQIITVQNFAAFDLSFGDRKQRFEGIQTPIFDETRMPRMQVGGFLGFLWVGLLAIANAIAQVVGPALLGFWDVFVGFLDTIFAWVGFPNAFSQFISLLGDAWNWFLTSVSYVVTMITQMFLFLAEVMTKIISLFTTLITQWISIATWFWYMLDTGFYSATGVWETLNIGQWVIIGAILYPVFLLTIWEEDGTQALFDHINFVVNVFLWFVHGFLTLTSFFADLIMQIVDVVAGLIRG